MVHGDDKGLKIPPKIAPTQVVIVPINPKKKSLKNFLFCNESGRKIIHLNIRTHIDDLDESPGFKFNKWELKGVPIRIEIGLKEFENLEVTVCRRDNSEKHQVQIDKIDDIPTILQSIQEIF